MGLLDWALPAASVYGQQRAGRQQGQMDSFLFQRKMQQEDEDRQRAEQQAALQQQLLQLQITKAQEGPQTPWDQAGFKGNEPGYLAYLKKVQAASNPQKSDPISWNTEKLPDGRVVQINPQTGESREVTHYNPNTGGDVNWENVQQPDGTVVQVNPRTGATRPVKFRGQPLKKGSGTTGGQPTEGERRAGALLTTARDAYPILQKATPPGFIENSLSKSGVGNAALSSRRQQALQAGAQFYRSYLYIVSGATVNPQEAEEAAKTFTPQFGDKPGTVARKRKAQQEMLKAMEQAGGRATTPDQTLADPISKAYSPDNPFAGLQ